jgi:VanZ family protein
MRRQILLTLACLLFGLSLFAIGLWPFNFRVDNHAELVPNAGGLKFAAPAERSKQDLGGMAFTPNPLVCRTQSSCEAGALTLEMVLKATTEQSPCLKRIVDVRNADGTEAFYICQWKSSFLVCMFNTPPNLDRPYCRIGVGGLLQAGRTSFVSITSGERGIDIYVDGQLLEQYPGFRLLKENEALDGHRLYFGNAPDLTCPWSGDIYAFALYDRVMSPSDVAAGWERWQGGRTLLCAGEGAVACYRLDRRHREEVADLSGSDNTLHVTNYLVFDKQVLRTPRSKDFFHQDTIINLLGFVPFGFMVCLRLLSMGKFSPRGCLFFAATLGFAVSLAIELTQVWLPGRDSSLLDLTTNTMGSAIGGAMAYHLGRAYGTWLKR